jgi:hypothetical protein
VATRENTNTDHPHEVLLPVLDVPAVVVALAWGSPAPETTTLLLFFTNRFFAGCIYGSVVIAKRS